MTEEIQSAVDVQSSGTSGSSPAPVSQSAETPTEKMVSIPQSQMDKIVKEAKRSAYEKGRSESSSSYQDGGQTQTFGGMPQFDQQTFSKLIDERLHNFSQEANRKAQEAEAARRVDEITTSLANKCLTVPEFEQKMQGFEWKPMSPLLPSLASKDNPGEMLLHLRDNPQKIANLLVLAHTQPALAEQLLNDLSTSIKTNQFATKQPTAREPLSQITPSVTGKDNGSLSVKDLRSHGRFKV